MRSAAAQATNPFGEPPENVAVEDIDVAELEFYGTWLPELLLLTGVVITVLFVRGLRRRRRRR